MILKSKFVRNSFFVFYISIVAVGCDNKGNGIGSNKNEPGYITPVSGDPDPGNDPTLISRNDEQTLQESSLPNIHADTIKTYLSKDHLVIEGDNIPYDGEVVVYLSPKKAFVLGRTQVKDNKFEMHINVSSFQITLDEDGNFPDDDFISSLFIVFDNDPNNMLNNGTVPDALLKNTRYFGSLIGDTSGDSDEETNETEINDNAVYYELPLKITDAAIIDLLAILPIGDLKEEHLKIKSYQDLVLSVLKILKDWDLEIDTGNLPTLGLINYYYASYDDPFSDQPFDPTHNKYNARDAFLIAYMVHNNYNYQFFINIVLKPDEQRLDIKEKCQLLFDRVDSDLLWQVAEKEVNYERIERALDEIGIAYELNYAGDIHNVVREDINYLNLARILIRIFGDQTLRPHWIIPDIGNYGELINNPEKFQHIDATIEVIIKAVFMEKLQTHQYSDQIFYNHGIMEMVYESSILKLMEYRYDVPGQYGQLVKVFIGYRSIIYAADTFDVLLKSQNDYPTSRVWIDIFDIKKLHDIDPQITNQDVQIAGVGGLSLQYTDLHAPWVFKNAIDFNRKYNHRNVKKNQKLDDLFKIPNDYEDWFKYNSVEHINLIEMGNGWSNNFNMLCSYYHSKKSGEKIYHLKIGNDIIAFDKDGKVLSKGIKAILNHISTSKMTVKINDDLYLFKPLFLKYGYYNEKRGPGYQQIDSDIFGIEWIYFKNGNHIHMEYENDNIKSIGDTADNSSFYVHSSIHYIPKRIKKIILYDRSDTEIGSYELFYKNDSYYRVNKVKTLGLNGQEIYQNYEYDENNYLSSVQNHLGEQVTYEYGTTTNKEDMALLTDITKADGVKLKYDYKFLPDENPGPQAYILKNKTVALDGKTFVTSYQYDDNSSQVNTKEGLPDKKFFNKQVITDPNGGKTEILTDKGKLTEKRYANGRIETWNWDYENNRLVEHTVTEKAITTTIKNLDFDTDNNPMRIETIISSGDQTSKTIKMLTYDLYLKQLGFRSKLKSKETYRESILIAKEEFEYDQRGRLTKQVKYNIGLFNQSGINKIITTYEYQNDDISSISIKNWDVDGNPVMITKTIEKTIDGTMVIFNIKEGQLVSIKAYDKFTGLLLKETDPNGAITTYMYDEKNRKTKTTYPNGATSQVIYDDTCDEKDGNMVKTVSFIDPLGIRKNQLYNQQGRLLEVSFDSSGDMVHLPREVYEYNDYGKIINKAFINSDQAEYISGFSFDPVYHDRLMKKTTPLTTIDYVYNDEERSISRMKKDTTTVKNMTLDKKLSNYTAENDQEVNTTYSVNNTLRKLIDSRAVTSFYHISSMGNLNRSNEQGNVNYITYDALNNVIKHSVGENKKEMYRKYFDSNNRLTKLVWENGFREYGYDIPLDNFPSKNQKGRLSWIKHDGNLEKAFGYDIMGNITDEELNIQSIPGANLSFNLEYKYDIAGNLVKEKYPDNTVVNYHYDQASQLTDVTSNNADSLRSIKYNSWGHISLIKLGNGITLEYMYENNTRRLISEQIKHGENVVQETLFDYDKNNNIKRISVSKNNGSETKISDYFYDLLDQLTKAVVTENGSETAYTYEYDESGNRVKVKRGDEKDRVSVINQESNRIEKIVDGEENTLLEFEWDISGNLVKKKDVEQSLTTEFTYNNINRLENVVIMDFMKNTQKNISFKYDSRGMLVSKKDHIKKTGKNYIYDKNDQLIQIADDEGNILKSYFYANGKRFAEKSVDGTIIYYLNDYLGNKRGIFGLDGEILDKQEFTPFGIPMDSSDNDEMSYTGKFYDKDVKLYYFHSRFYDAQLGIFLTKDPAEPDAADPITLNPYTYVKNNPVMNIDSNGEFWWIIGAVIGAIQGYNSSNGDIGSTILGVIAGGLLGFGFDILVADYGFTLNFQMKFEVAASQSVTTTFLTQTNSEVWVGIATMGIPFIGYEVDLPLHDELRNTNDITGLETDPYVGIVDLFPGSSYVDPNLVHTQVFEPGMNNNWGYNGQGMITGDNNPNYTRKAYVFSDHQAYYQAKKIIQEKYTQPPYLDNYDFGQRKCHNPVRDLIDEYENISTK